MQLKKTNIRVFELVAPAANTPLNDKFTDVDGFDAKSLMEPGKIADIALEGLKSNKFEIYPGISKIIKVMARVAPKFLLSQTSKVGANIMQ